MILTWPTGPGSLTRNGQHLLVGGRKGHIVGKPEKSLWNQAVQGLSAHGGDLTDGPNGLNGVLLGFY